MIKSIKKIITKPFEFFLNLTTAQKVFLLILIFNSSSQGEWVELFQNTEGTSWWDSQDEIFYGVNLTCIFGFFLFWKK